MAQKDVGAAVLLGADRGDIINDNVSKTKDLEKEGKYFNMSKSEHVILTEMIYQLNLRTFQFVWQFKWLTNISF